MPLPNEETTPPVTKMYLVLVVMIFNPLRLHKMLQHNKNIKLYLNSLQAAKPHGLCHLQKNFLNYILSGAETPRIPNA